MATVSRPASDSLAVAEWAADGDAESKSDRYLAKRLAAAGAEFKGVALTTFLLAAGVGVMLWLAVGVIAEHWLVAGGLPVWARGAWLATGLVLLAAAVVRWVVPLLRYRVNLVYAARMLEQEHPELHNDLVNAVLAQSHADETTADHASGDDARRKRMLRLLRRRAARQLAGTSGDGAVDRGTALKLAYALAAMIAAACIYELVAPKSLIASAARLVAPWLGVAAPSRVKIVPPRLSWSLPDGPKDAGREQAVAVVSGVATHVRGRQLVVASDITGLAAAEKPELLVTPVGDDGMAAASGGWRVAMVPAAGDTFTSVLSDVSRGLDQSVDIVVAAGDARSERIRVAVVDEPAMLVREVHYHYPAYTGQRSETIPWQGDVRGIEGTEVTVVAESNHPLEAAWIDLGVDGKRDAPMAIDPKDLAKARGTFRLRLSPDRSAAEHRGYRLLFQPKSAPLSQPEKAVVDKMEYRIEVLPDLAPEITIEEPAEKVVRVPPDAPVTVRLRAIDPDFGLASVTVETRLAAGAERPGPELLVGPRKTFRGAATLIPAALGAGPGQKLEYRGVAKDTRPDAPHVRHTEWYALQIDPSAPPREPPPAPPEDEDKDEADEANGQPQDGDAPPDRRGQQGDKGDGSSAGEDNRQGDSEKGRDSDAGTQDKSDGAASDKPDGNEGAAESRDGKKGGPKGDGGSRQGEQSPSQRQPDPTRGEKQGEPQEGEQQGSAEGGKPNDANEGQAGKQPGQQQQQGSQDGDGSEPEGQGGSQQRGGQAGSKPDGGPGAEQRPSGGGGEGEGKPGARKAGGDSSTSGQQSGDQQGGGEQPGRQGDKGDRPGKGGKGTPRPKENVAADGTDDGEAIERILEHRSQAQKQGSQGSKESGGQGGARESSDGGDRGGQPKNGSQGDEPRDPSGGQPSGNNADAKPKQNSPAAPGESAEPKPPACAAADGQPCGKEGCASCGGGSSSGKAGEGKAGEGKAGEGKAGEGKAGEGKAGEGKAGEGKAGEGKAGEGKAGEGKAGEGKAGEGKPGEGKPGEGKPGEGGERDVSHSDGNDSGGATVGGGAIGGDRGAGGGNPQAERQDREMEWGEQDLAHARNAADLAIEHLKNAVDAGDAGMLDELGWTPDQARAFLERWEAMRRMARSGDSRARSEFDQAVKSLGLRPTGVRSSRDVPSDVKGGQAEGRRSRPPNDYREQFKAFMQGTSAE